MKSGVTRIINIFLLLLGIGLLVVLLLRLDLQEVKEKLLLASWQFVLAFVAYVLGLFVTTKAWQAIIDPDTSRASYRDLLAAFWAGHAINQLTPASSLGEVLRGTLMSDKVDGEELIASLVTLNFLGTFVIQVFTVIGPLICLLFLDLPDRVMLATLGVALALFVPVTFLYVLLRLGLVSGVVRIARKLPLVKIKNPEILLAKARSVDRRIQNFTSRQPKRFVRVVLLLFSVRLLQVVEVWVLLLALLPLKGAAWLLLLAVLTQTVSQLVVWVLTFVPGQVGVAEAGSALLFRLLGLDPLVGFSMELLRRIRMILGVSIGLLIGWRMGIRSSKAKRLIVASKPQCEPKSHHEGGR